MPDELTLTIVGIDFPNPDKSKSNRRMELLLTPPGEPVELVLEPKNPHEADGISMWSVRAPMTSITTPMVQVGAA